MKKPKAKTPKATYQTEKIALFLLRVGIGWFFLYSGLIKFSTPGWTSAGFLESSNTLSSLYTWLASSSNIGWVDFLNVWGQILIGAGLITGTFTRIASWAGVLLMILYYIPGVEVSFVFKVIPLFYVDHGLFVDQHVIYALAFMVLASQKAGQYWGLDQYIACKKAK